MIYFTCFLLSLYPFWFLIHWFAPIHKKEKWFSDVVNICFKYVLNIKLDLSSVEKNLLPSDSALIICNHPSIMDPFTLSALHSELFPNHQLIYIAKETIGEIPIIGNYFKKGHVLLTRDIIKDKERLVYHKQRLLSSQKPFILYLFPEGTTFCPSTYEKSCFQVGTRRPHWKHLLRPKGGAFSEFLDIVGDRILDMTILYTGRGKDEDYSDLFYGKYPAKANIVIKNISNEMLEKMKNKDIKEITTLLEKIWDEKDLLLSDHHSAFIKTGIPKNLPILFSTSICFLHTPLIYYFFGCFPFLSSLLLGLTAIEYHLWGRHRYLDIFISSSTILYFFFRYSSHFAKFSLVLGVLIYLLESLMIFANYLDFESIYAHMLHFYVHVYSFFSILFEIYHQQTK